MLPHSLLLLLRRWLGEHWGGKGPEAARYPTEGLLSTLLCIQSALLLSAAFSNPNPLTGAC